MDSQADVVDSIRKMAISRRGGVRTRGGRLPPINMREIAQMTSKKETKKFIVPNIPQRRKVKQEVEIKTERLDPVLERRPNFESARGRGRGRQPKVLLQTEGTFMAEGPAAKIKKDPLAYERFSIPRFSKASASREVCDVKYDDEALRNLLEYYDEFGEYEDEYGVIPPYRLPLPKPRKSVVPKRIIKAEPADEDEIKRETIKIKKEIKSEDDDDTKEKVIKTENEIKSEKDDDDDDFIGRRKIKIKKEVLSDSEDDDVKAPKSEVDVSKEKLEENDSKTEKEKSADFVQNADGKGKMILLQIPSYTSVLKAENVEGSSKDKTKGIEEQPEEISTFIDSLEEGYIGKLQIMKSGRMKLKLGPAEFELLDGSPSDSYWEAVSIQMRDDGGDMSVLGKMERKLILTPILKMLLSKDQAIGCKK